MTLIDCNTLSLPVYHQLLEFTQTHLHWVSDAIQPQPSHPLSSPSPPAFNLSLIRVSSNESALHIRWPNCWSFCFNISPSNEHSELIAFRMDWLDLLAIQWTPKSLLQHHSSKASVLRHSAFSTVQFSHPYMTTAICSDFGGQENKVSHCFLCFPIYLTWSDGTKCHGLSFLNV